MMRRFSLCIALLLSVFCFAFSAQAVGLLVSPKEIKISSSVGETAVQKLKVKNPSGEVSVFEVYPDDLEAIIKIAPASFILESNQEKEVDVRATPREEGILKTNISVVATPVANSSFNTGSGVKIPLEISTGKGKSWSVAMVKNFSLSTIMAIAAALLFLIAASVFFVIRFKFH